MIDSITAMLERIPAIPRVSEIRAAGTKHRAEIQKPEGAHFKYVLDQETEKLKGRE